ncbi:MAG: GLPGLI family protein [Saprospiraceae bacterium]
MKHLWTILSLILFAEIQGNAQGLTVVYEYRMTRYPDIVLQDIPSLSEQDIRNRYSLTISGSVSKFSRDSVYVASYPYNGGQSVIPFQHIYKNYNEDLWIRSSGDYKEGYAVSKKLSYISENRNYNWQITQEQKQIAGITCTKAVSKQGTATAWFAPSLPYSDGPQEGVFNLPGLVLYLETPNEKWETVEMLLHDTSIEIPAFNLVPLNDNKITISLDEVRALGTDRAIQINENTTKGMWFKFE